MPEFKKKEILRFIKSLGHRITYDTCLSSSTYYVYFFEINLEGGDSMLTFILSIYYIFGLNDK